MASGSPRKRRLGRLYDKMYGDGTRGSHYDSQMYASRSVAERTTDITSYVTSGSAAYLTSSMQFSSSATNRRLVKIDGLSALYNQGSGSYGFACWVKMDASGSSPMGVYSFGGAAASSSFFAFGLETSGSGYQPMVKYNSGTGSASSSFATLGFATSTWTFLSYTETRVGSNRAYTASLNASTFVSGTWPAFDATFNSSSLAIIRSGSDLGAGVNGLTGRMHQAAFWNELRTNAQMSAVYNNGTSDNWSDHLPDYYWSLGVSDGITIDAMLGTIAGTVVSGTLVADTP